MRRSGLLVLGAALGLGCPSTRPAGPPPQEENMGATHWEVYDGTDLVLTIDDRPGAIVSTAPLPPGREPLQHPFLSARAHSAAHEHQVKALLDASSSTEDFLRQLEEAGLRVQSAD